IEAILYDTNGRIIEKWDAQHLHDGRQQIQFLLKRRRIILGHYFLEMIDGDGRIETRVVIR
ncbi:MAG: hypothetical protein AAFY41_17615, partial [Bacteroidota bacterium]